MLLKSIKNYFVLVLMVFSANSYAEDIDIFLNPPIDKSGNPNVLFVLDNTANWASNIPPGITKFEAEVTALKAVIADLDENVNVGLMMLTEPSQGGYVRFGVRPMDEDNKALFTKVLNGLIRNADNTAGAGVYGSAMFEAYKYFGGGNGTGTQGKTYHGPLAHSGRIAGSSNKLQDKRDYVGNPWIYGTPGTLAEPLLFYIETMGVFLDNYPVYTLSCDGVTIASAMVTPGIEVFVPNLTCPTAGKAWTVNVQSTGYGDMVTWYLKDKNGVTIFSGGPYGYGFNDTRIDMSGGLIVSDGAAFSSAAALSYTSPITEQCGKNYIILVSNGSPPTNSDNAAAILLKNIGGDTTVIELPSARSTSNYGDEFARFLYDNDVSPLDGKQNVVTYTLAVFSTVPKIAALDENNIELMKSIANQGKGRYFAATSAAEIAEALTKILSEVQAVDSVFASVTLPVSVNVRGTHLNQVYMGVFRPDAMDMPRWPGNLKHFKLKSDSATGEVFLADVNGLKVHSDLTGFIVSDAESFWTRSSSFWDFAPSGTPPSGSDLPDGPIVEKGGVAQQIREQYPTDQSTRNMLTQNMNPFTTDFLTTDASVQAQFDVDSADELKALVNWIRGADNYMDEDIDGDFADIRPSIHGDVLHSQPAVINYSSDENDVVAYYGANDGLLRAVRVGDGPEGGKELWAYIAEEFYPKFDALRENDTPRSVDDPKPYFFDGPITTMIEDGEYYIYVTSRRGGDVVYAFNVTDPDAPKFLWKLTSGTSNMSEMGQAWSAASVVKTKAHSNPVLVMGGGYDAENQDKSFPGDDDEGRAIFAIDALTGDVLWQAGPIPEGAVGYKVEDMKYSIPSDVTVFDRNGDGFTDRGYVGDMGGNIWRIDMTDSFADWKVSRFAHLGMDDTANPDHRRKFFYAVDVTFTSDANGKYDAILVGSGDREKPFEDRVQNKFFMLKDRYVSGIYAGSIIKIEDLYDATANLIKDGSAAQQAAAAEELLAAEGAYFDLLPGEKAISKTVTVGGVSLFNTNQPESTSGEICSAGLGVARLYQVNFKDLSGAVDNTDRFVISPGGGLPPSPTYIIFDDNGDTKEVGCVGTDCEEIIGSDLGARLRAFWIELID